MIKKSLPLLFIFCSILFFSCNTLSSPQNVTKNLDYTDDDVRQNEINNIKKLQTQEIVKALYRSYFLGDSAILRDTIQIAEDQILLCIEQSDFSEASRIYKALETLNHKSTKISARQIQELSNKDLPGSQISENKKPKNIAECINATVTIWVDKGLKVSNGAGYQDIVIGSGFFIDERGYLVTNYHVIESMVDSKYEGYSRLYIKLPSDPNTKIPAKVIGYDQALDLALVKTEITPPFCLSLGSSSELNLGDKISAIGTPIGLEGTLTSGIISAVNRKLSTMGSVFQIDAAVNSGNSGGPLIDQNMKVQAIVFAGMLQYQGLNFAIPVEYLKQELPVLYKGGNVLHTWIGAYGNTKRISGKDCGLEIFYVMPGGSAHFSSLKEGDVIKELNGHKIECLEDFQFALLAFEPGNLLPLKYVDSSGNEKQTVIYLDKRPVAPGVMFYNSDLINEVFVPLFGMKLTPSSTINKKLYTITKVINGSTADEMGFSENDPVTIQKIELDDKQKAIIAQLYVQRKKKGFLNISMVAGASYDSPYYF